MIFYIFVNVNSSHKKTNNVWCSALSSLIPAVNLVKEVTGLSSQKDSKINQTGVISAFVGGSFSAADSAR